MSYLASDKYSIIGAYSMYRSLCEEEGIKVEPIETFEDSIDVFSDIEAILKDSGRVIPKWLREILDDRS